MDTLRSIESFVKAVQGGSIAAGARLQGITPAAASQNIQRLEKSLGTRLLVRTTRKLALTESGEVYYSQVQDIIEGLARAQSAIGEFQGQPQGADQDWLFSCIWTACADALNSSLYAQISQCFRGDNPFRW